MPMTFFEHLKWFWKTRNCEHKGGRRRIGGEERMMYGYFSRCLNCGKALKFSE